MPIPITYKKSGVDIARADDFLRSIKGMVSSTRTRGAVSAIGGFAGLYDPLKEGFDNPILVSSTDGVGTKLKVAAACGIHDTVGVDLVAMNVNDILACGAKPLFLLDYIATSRIDTKVLKDVIKGIVYGCRQAGCALLGGETAEMPGMYSRGEYDLAAFCVGAVDRKKIIDGSKVRAGDILVGAASSGLHSNGYSLVRKLFSEREMKARAKEFLKPTTIYVNPVLDAASRYRLKAIAHITGGGFIDNIPRVIPAGLRVKIRRGSWPIPGIFSELNKRSKAPDREIFRTFNMGIGLVIVVGKSDAASVIKRLSRFKLKSYVIGEIKSGRKGVDI
ncbi:MAG: phosphoribosylformylglycinamidine cyclo-ligase [Candidatus Omnitrophica bacterium CG1_02_49_10]|nr:MAG: phosphoribosylformylglycinamidine cyclo-ligase [Candidatus Omnitrophica bacterium CG1_02_49_10]